MGLGWLSSWGGPGIRPGGGPPRGPPGGGLIIPGGGIAPGGGMGNGIAPGGGKVPGGGIMPGGGGGNIPGGGMWGTCGGAEEPAWYAAAVEDDKKKIFNHNWIFKFLKLKSWGKNTKQKSSISQDAC